MYIDGVRESSLGYDGNIITNGCSTIHLNAGATVDIRIYGTAAPKTPHADFDWINITRIH